MSIADFPKTVSDFSLLDEKGHSVSLFSIPHKWVVLFFYPKDMTPGCTVESKDFSSLKEEFEKFDTKVFGVSADDSDSHAQFCKKENLTVPLLADTEKSVCKSFGVWQKKMFFGKESEGIVRTTFLIDISKKEIVHVWENVKVPGHAKEVFSFVKQECK